jgi:hypothetical protein
MSTLKALNAYFKKNGYPSGAYRVYTDENGNEVTENTGLSNGQIATIVNEWKAANGYKEDRAKAYPLLAEQLDKLYHDIANGTVDQTGEFFTAINAVKTQFPKG